MCILEHSLKILSTATSGFLESLILRVTIYQLWYEKFRISNNYFVGDTNLDVTATKKFIVSTNYYVRSILMTYIARV